MVVSFFKFSTLRVLNRPNAFHFVLLFSSDAEYYLLAVFSFSATNVH